MPALHIITNGVALTMPTDAEYQQLVSVCHQLKGEFLFLQAFLISVSRALPGDQKDLFLAHFHKMTEEVRTSFLYSEANDEVSRAFEHYVAALLNPSRGSDQNTP